MTLRLVPIFITDARRKVAEWHRHNEPPLSGLFAVGVENGDGLCGIAIVGRPTGRGLQDGFTCEITRVATTGTYNACSMLYGACRRAAAALGYQRVYSYTLETEPGTSLQAAGFVRDALLPARATWNCKARERQQKNLFGQNRRPPEAKWRWVWPATAREQVQEMLNRKDSK